MKGFFIVNKYNIEFLFDIIEKEGFSSGLWDIGEERDEEKVRQNNQLVKKELIEDVEKELVPDYNKERTIHYLEFYTNIKRYVVYTKFFRHDDEESINFIDSYLNKFETNTNLD